MDREIIRRRQLPHWDMPGAPYFVTTCLEGSIPARGLLEIVRYRDEALSHRNARSSTMRCRQKLYDALSVRTVV